MRPFLLALRLRAETGAQAWFSASRGALKQAHPVTGKPAPENQIELNNSRDGAVRRGRCLNSLSRLSIGHSRRVSFQWLEAGRAVGRPWLENRVPWLPVLAFVRC